MVAPPPWSPGARREDLLQLTPQAVAHLANLGLVKRAQKELDEGPAPQLETDEQGTLIAVFADGTRARLVRGKALKDCPCSCGASSVCRHRVGAILAYQRAYQRADAATPATAPAAWSPADIDDEALEKLLGRSALERARRLCRRGLLVEVLPGSSGGEALPEAQLATSTVRFLVAGDPGYARCDCRARTACEHVALAVWAFRAARARPASGPKVMVELGELGAGADQRRGAALEAARSLADEVLLEGAARRHEAAGTRFALVTEALTRAGAAWPLEALEDLEELLQAYGRRSARYAPSRLADTLVDLVGRARAGSRTGERSGAMPPAAVLGCDEAGEVALDQLRLLALGARITADGDDRQVEVLLAEPGSPAVLVLRRHYLAPRDGAAALGSAGVPALLGVPGLTAPPVEMDGAALGRRQGLAGASLAQLASCQLVSNAAVRRPNRTVSFTTGPLRKTSVLPGGAALQSLPGPLVVSDVVELERELAARPPRVLRPRLVAENVRVFAVGAVLELVYDAGQQALTALCADPRGGHFLVCARHRSVAPGVLPALARLLSGGAPPQAVVGEVSRREARLVVEPLAVWADRPVVLDLEEVTDEGVAALARVTPGRLEGPGDPVGRAVNTAREVLAGGAHAGLRSVSDGWMERLREAGAGLKGVGLERAAADLEALDHALLAARATGSGPDEAAAAAAWASAALRLELLADRL